MFSAILGIFGTLSHLLTMLPVLSAVVNTITEGVVQDEAVLFFSGAQAEETLQGIALQGALYRNVELLP